MRLVDVNVLVYAHREESPDHARHKAWLEDLINGDESFGMTDLVLSGFVRVVTHARIFDPPSPTESALKFAEQVRGSPRCVRIEPGRRHWEIFTRLCRDHGAKGKLVADAYLAALAIESGSMWITTDGDFARFDGLRHQHPLRASRSKP